MRGSTVVLVALLACVAPSAAADIPVVTEGARAQALQHYSQGQGLLSREHWEEAVAEFRKAAALDPLMPMAQYGIGQAQLALKQYPEAIQALTQCREIYVLLSSAGMKATAAAEQARTYEIQVLRDTISILQRNATLGSQNQSSIIRMEERLRELEHTNKADALDSEASAVPAMVYLSLGSAHFRNGSMPDAEREYTMATKMDPKMGEAHNNLAVVYLLTGRPADAQAQLKLAEKSGFQVNPRLKDDVKKAVSNAQK